MATMMQLSQFMKWGVVRTIIARLLGLFLLVTAALKVHGLIVDPYGQDNFLALPWLQVLTIEVEVLLGLWLLSGWKDRLAWWSALAFFCVLICLSLILASQGQASCGCFGKVEVNPWWTFSIDAGIVIVLLCFQYFIGEDCKAKERSSTPPLRPTFQVLLMTTVLLSILSLGFTLFSDDPWTTLTKLRGETLVVSPAITNLGEGMSGEHRTFQVQLRNISDRPIKVAGGSTSCTCIATRDLPVTILPGSNNTVRVVVKFSGSPGRFTHKITFYTDSISHYATARCAGLVVLSNSTEIETHDYTTTTSNTVNRSSTGFSCRDIEVAD